MIAITKKPASVLAMTLLATTATAGLSAQELDAATDAVARSCKAK